MAEDAAVNSPTQGRGEKMNVVSEDTALPTGPRIKFFACNTSQPGCAGVAIFVNNGGQVASYTVWFGNGANGHSSFVLDPGQTHGLHCQSGDTYSSVWGNQGVPPNAQRYWIVVG
jgi:hypothetical protein